MVPGFTGCPADISQVMVEAMCNELAAQYSFSLLCSCPAGPVRGDQHQDARAEVCRVHTSVPGDVPRRA